MVNPGLGFFIATVIIIVIEAWTAWLRRGLKWAGTSVLRPTYYWPDSTIPQSRLTRFLLIIARWWDNVPRGLALGDLQEKVAARNRLVYTALEFADLRKGDYATDELCEAAERYKEVNERGRV